MLAPLGYAVTRCGLVTVFVWVGALKFKAYEVENSKQLLTASPLTKSLYRKLGARNLCRLVGVSQMAMGVLVATRPFAPRLSALGSLGSAGLMCGTLSFLVSTPEAWQEDGVPQLSMLGESLLKDSVLLGAALVTAAEALHAA